jgi:uncharacterized membrane protein
MDTKKDPDNQNKTSANIGLSLSTTQLETAPGQSVETVLKIRNQSNIVDRFHIKVEGLDPNWWTLSIPTFASFPGDVGESKLTVHPPREAEAIAGSYSFRVKVNSEANPQEETVVAALLLLHGFITWEVEVSPTKVVGRSGTYRITTRNSGNADAVIVLEGKDPEEELIFNFSRDKVSVPAGGSAQVQLTVYPKKGEQQKLYTFQVTSKYAGPSKEIKMFIGQLEYASHRTFPWWLIPAALGIIGIILILLGTVAGVYKTTTLFVFTSTPYRGYMVPLIISGAILIIAGAVIGRWKKR